MYSIRPWNLSLSEVSIPKANIMTESTPVPIDWSRGVVVKRRFNASPTDASINLKIQTKLFGEHILRTEVLYKQTSELYIQTGTEHRFNQLAQQWKADTALLSDLSKKSMHPDYQRIIGMGQDALPFLLKELERHPSHWFWALRAITGANPVKSGNRGRIKQMAQDWLAWGRDHGYQC